MNQVEEQYIPTLFSTADGVLVIRLYVDRWEWLIPLVTSYGGDVLIEEPAELRDAIVRHLRRALDTYEQAARSDQEAATAGFRNDARDCVRRAAEP